MRATVAALFLTVLSATSAAAQGVDIYITAGSGSIDYLVARETIPQVSVGVLVRPVGDWFRAGVEADVFTSNGYFSGRGGPLAELALLGRSSRVQPFVRGGYFFGEDNCGSPAAGSICGLRSVLASAFVQDAFRGVTLTYGNPAITYSTSRPCRWVGYGARQEDQGTSRARPGSRQ